MDYLDYPASGLQRKINAILAKPHQPFFIMGIIVAIIGIALTGAILNGHLDANLKSYHVFTMAILMPTSLFLGFLFTVVYRFLLVNSFPKKEYMRVFWFLLFGTALSQVGFFVSDIIVVLSAILVLIAQILSITQFVRAYKKSTVDDKRDVFWILVTFSSGALATLLFAASIFSDFVLQLALYMAFYPFAVGVVFAVAQKMIPNFFSIYFSIMLPEKNHFLMPMVAVSLFGIAISNAFSITTGIFVFNATGLIALLMLFYQYKLIIRKAPPVLWILQIGALWLLIGFAAGIAESITQSVPVLLQIHIWGIGFITTLIIGFGSRVAMGHSGRKIVADKKTTVIFISIIFLSIIRALGVFDAYLLNISIYVWCIVFTIWLYFYAPMLLSE